ncbi:MAG: hypothetical protein ACRD1E_08360, partial [Terriglobales bacterium]
QAFIGKLKDPDPNVRTWAMGRIADVGEPDPDFIAALAAVQASSPDAGDRRFAAKVIEHLHSGQKLRWH